MTDAPAGPTAATSNGTAFEAMSKLTRKLAAFSMIDNVSPGPQGVGEKSSTHGGSVKNESVDGYRPSMSPLTFVALEPLRIPISAMLLCQVAARTYNLSVAGAGAITFS